MREKENHPLINKQMHFLNHSDSLNERQMQMYMTWENEMLRVEGKNGRNFYWLIKWLEKVTILINNIFILLSLTNKYPPGIQSPSQCFCIYHIKCTRSSSTSLPTPLPLSLWRRRQLNQLYTFLSFSLFFFLLFIWMEMGVQEQAGLQENKKVIRRWRERITRERDRRKNMKPQSNEEWMNKLKQQKVN